MNSAFSVQRSPFRQALCGLIRFYQVTVSPMLPNSCRFYPSCSEYMRQSILQFGVLRGVARGFGRLLRCNPFCEGGYDPVQNSDELRAMSDERKTQERRRKDAGKMQERCRAASEAILQAKRSCKRSDPASPALLRS